MNKVVIDMTMSLDGFVAGPGDGKEFPLGKNDGEPIFDWYFSGKGEYCSQLFHPEPGADLDQVKLMYEELGAFIFGRRTYDITNGWNGAHPLRMPCRCLFSPTRLRHPRRCRRDRRTSAFVTDGIASAIRQARAVAGGGASPGQQALKAGLCDEILIHRAPHLLGDGVRLFDRLGGPVRLEKTSAADGPLPTHVRYRMHKA